jgi:uncharacterized membrane protein
MQAIAQSPMGANTIGMPQTGSESKGPEKKFRAGAVAATVWKNEHKRATGEAFSSYSISLDRSYKDQAGNWKNTASMRLQDIPKAALVLNEAYRYLTLNGAQADDVVVE